MLRFAKVFALGAWIGAIIYFAAVVTRGAFAVLPNRDQAGLLVGFTLGGLHVMGLIAALVFVIASLAIGKSLRTFIEPAVAARDSDGCFHDRIAGLRDSSDELTAGADGLR